MGEQARPVLGAQPPALRSRPIRYVDAQEGRSSLEMVPSAPYYYEEDAPSLIQSYNAASEQGNETSGHMISMDAQTFMLMANGGYRPQNNYGKRGQGQGALARPCFLCQGDHWIRDCPHEQEEKETPKAYSWPRVSEIWGVWNRPLCQRLPK